MIGAVEFFGERKEYCSYRAVEFVKLMTLKREKALAVFHSQAGCQEDIVCLFFRGSELGAGSVL